MQSLQGQLLVSSPSLNDPNFRKTVVLIAHHDEEGAMGLVLSRPSDVAAGEAVPALQLLPGADDPVYVGGPVQPEAFMVLAEFDDVDAAAAPIFGSVGFMPAEAEPDELAIRRFRLFSGYAGWGAGSDTPGQGFFIGETPEDLLRLMNPTGTPKEIAALLRPMIEPFRDRSEFHFIVRLHYPGMSFETASRAIELFGEQVLPALQGA